MCPACKSGCSEFEYWVQRRQRGILAREYGVFIRLWHLSGLASIDRALPVSRRPSAGWFKGVEMPVWVVTRGWLRDLSARRDLEAIIGVQCERKRVRRFIKVVRPAEVIPRRERRFRAFAPGLPSAQEAAGRFWPLALAALDGLIGRIPWNSEDFGGFLDLEG